MKQQSIASTELLIAGIFFGTIPIFASLSSLAHVSAIQQISLRLFLSMPIFIMVLLVFRRKDIFSISKSDFFRFLLYGLFIFSAFLSYLESLALGTPVATAAFLASTQPIFVVLLSKIFLSEKITKFRIAGVILGIAGVFFILQIWEQGSHPVNVGEILALLNGVLYASYIVITKKAIVARNYHPISLVAWVFVAASLWALLLLPINYMEFQQVPSKILQLNSDQWQPVLGLVIVSTIIPYTLLNLGIRKIDASRAGVLLLVEPVAATILGYLILNQSVLGYQIIGSFLILTGIFLVTLKD